MSTQQADYQKFFYTFGVQLRLRRDQLVGTCPFCEKEDHLFVSPQTGQWDCKRCAESGNHSSFLVKLHNQCVVNHPTLFQLATDRGLKLDTLNHAEIRLNPLTNWFVFPSRNLKGAISNLYSIKKIDRDGKQKLEIHSSPHPCEQQLYRINTIRSQETVWFCEGHWDALALVETFAHLQERDSETILKGRPNYDSEFLKHNAVVGIPGSTFRDTWLRTVRGKNLVFLYDNDEPGKKFLDRTKKLIVESELEFESVSFLNWAPGDPKDIRDLLFV